MILMVTVSLLFNYIFVQAKFRHQLVVKTWSETPFFPDYRPQGSRLRLLGQLNFTLRNQRLSRLAARHEPSVYPTWRLPTNPAFTPLDGSPRAQCLPRLAAVREPSVYPAWRLSANPAFIPLDGLPRA